VSFSFHEPNTEGDGSKVQGFLTEMEGAIRDHPLWANATNQEIDHALEVKPHRSFFPPLVLLSRMLSALTQ
jgi:hypothetical protein